MLGPAAVVGLALAILLLPLAAFVPQLLWWKRLPRQGDWLPTSAIALALGCALTLLVHMLVTADPGFRVTAQADWIRLAGGPTLRMGVVVDNMAILMMVVVTLVSFLVHLFSIGYMHGDARYGRYFAFLALFSFSMLGIVLSDNLLSLYIFWELVGVASYLLIGFWFEKDSAADASKKAFLTNRIGDAGMLVGIAILVLHTGTFNLHDLFAAVREGGAWTAPEHGFLGVSWLTWAGIGLFCGAIGKSAQFPLHVWLPDAMEGPTPVSALIHAATMVAAGVYLTARISPLLTPAALLFVAVIGVTTAFLAATIALVQNDIKKVLAYSTISQLGYMIMALGLGGYVAGFLHLTTHAMFKACLFLGSGSVIHAVHSQDMRDMGGLRRKMPLTFLTFLLATLAISGVPLMSGFYSKDMILATALAGGMAHGGWHWLFPVVGFGVAGLTAFYMFRLVFMTFAGAPRDAHRFGHAHESPAVMAVPLIILAFLSFAIWYQIPSQGTPWFERLVVAPPSAVPEALQDPHEMPPAREHHIHEQAHHLAGTLSLAVAGTGILLAGFLYLVATALPGRIAAAFPTVHAFLMAKWRFDELYRQVPVLLTLDLSYAAAWFDRNVVDRIVNAVGSLGRAVSLVAGAFDAIVVDGLVNGTADTVAAWGHSLRRIQTGQLQAYVALLAWGAIGLVLWQVIAAGPAMPDFQGFDPLYFLDMMGLRSR